MIVEDDVVIFFDKSLARIEPNGNVIFAPNWQTGGWKKPYFKKGKPSVLTFTIGTKSKEEAISVLNEMGKLLL